MKEIFALDPDLANITEAAQAPSVSPAQPTPVGQIALAPKYVKDFEDPEIADYWKDAATRTKALQALSNKGELHTEAQVDAAEKAIQNSIDAAIALQKKRYGNYTLKRGQFWEMAASPSFYIAAGSSRTVETTVSTSTTSEHSTSISTSSGIEVGTSKSTATQASANVGLSFSGFGAGASASRTKTERLEQKITNQLQISTVTHSSLSTNNTLSISNTYTGGDTGRWYLPYQLVDRFVIVRSDGVQIAETEFLGTIQVFNSAGG